MTDDLTYEELYNLEYKRNLVLKECLIIQNERVKMLIARIKELEDDDNS